MTLRVPFDAFPDAAKRVAGSDEAYVAGYARGSVVTSANPSKSVVVTALSKDDPAATMEKVRAHGMKPFEGSWSEDDLLQLEADPMSQATIGAVSYTTSESIPGLWLDAFPEQPTHVQVLKNMYDELRETGELGPVNFEEFVRLSSPNVVVVTPEQLRGFLAANVERGAASKGQAPEELAPETGKR
jgi:hypothetical protein